MGLKARWAIEPVLKTLISGAQLSRLQRDYLSSLLEAGDLSVALEGKEPPQRQIDSTVDALLRKGAVYRPSDKFR